MRSFVGADLSREAASDTTTLLKFRHLLEVTQAQALLHGDETKKNFNTQKPVFMAKSSIHSMW